MMDENWNLKIGGNSKAGRVWIDGLGTAHRSVKATVPENKGPDPELSLHTYTLHFLALHSERTTS